MIRKIRILVIFLFFISVFSFAQTITVTSPHSGEKWYKGQSYTIRWIKSGSMDSQVKITLYKPDHTTLQTVIVRPTANSGSYSWVIPNSIPNGQYIVRVKTMDNAVYDDSDVFTIENAPIQIATITVTRPHSGETWKKGQSYTIMWTKSGSMDSEVKITLYKPDHTTLQTVIVRPTANSGSYSWVIPNSIPNGQYIVRVKTMDNAVYGDSDVFNIKESNISINTNLNINKKFTLVGFPELEVYGTSLHFTGNKSGEVKFHVAVRNIGKVDVSNVPYTFIIDGPPGKYDYYSLQGHFASIPKRMTVVFDKTYVLEDEGKYKFSFEVNPNHRAFVEYKYDNNKFEKEIKYIGAPDLVVRVIVGMHSRVAFSHKVWFEVKNIGTRASSECKLRTYIEGKGVKFFDVPHLYPGEKATFTRTVKWLTLGYKKIEAKVDYYNIIREKNENNNKTEVKTKVITGTIFD